MVEGAGYLEEERELALVMPQRASNCKMVNNSRNC